MPTYVQLLLPKMFMTAPRKRKTPRPAPPDHFWKDLTSGKLAWHVHESAPGQRINNKEETYNILKPMFLPQDDVEQFFCIFLTSRNRIIEIEKLFSGSISSSAIYPREVVKRCLALKATAVIFGHNHPSGEATPSPEDYAITRLLFVALKSCGVTMHEHMVVGEGFFSMAATGFIQKITTEYDRFMEHGA